MKLGMTSLTFREESVETVIRNAKEAGIEGIEWGVSDGHMALCNKERAEKIKKLSAKNNLEIFSLGSYCRMLSKEECDDALKTAVMLGAPIIRVWAGAKSPESGDDEYFNEIVENTIYMAEKAEKYNIVLGFECHMNTLTEVPEVAIRLIEKVSKKNVGMYWQPLVRYSPEENVSVRKKITPYLVGNIHIHNYSVEKGYQPLSEIEDRLNLYYQDIKDKDYKVMIEFVKDSSLSNLISDAETLRKVLR